LFFFFFFFFNILSIYVKFITGAWAVGPMFMIIEDIYTPLLQQGGIAVLTDIPIL